MKRRQFLSAAGSGASAASVEIGIDNPSFRHLGRLDKPSPRVVRLARGITAKSESKRDQALALFRFVRDHIQFGFTDRFDLATPDQTLDKRRGHCNPQAALFVAMLRSVDIPARQHFVTIENDILEGLFPGDRLPPLLMHSYTYVQLDGEWLPVDSYILDPPMFRAVKRKLEQTGKPMGFGGHVAGANEWDGHERAMCQLVSDDMVIRDHGCFLEPDELYTSDHNPQRQSLLDRFMYRSFAVTPTNKRIAAIRASTVE